MYKCCIFCFVEGDEVSLKKGVRLSYLLPELTENKLRYYTYKGSITTPPCYESVRWFVMKSPIAITKQQVLAKTLDISLDRTVISVKGFAAIN